MISPMFDINYDSTHGSLCISFYDEELCLLFPYIEKYMLNLYRGSLALAESIQNIKYDINNFLNRLISEGYLKINFDAKWKLDIVRFVLDNIESIREDGTLDEGKNILARCLIKQDGTLCDQIKTLPASNIESLCGLFHNKSFDDAIEIYKNEVTLGLAGVPEEEKNV